MLIKHAVLDRIATGEVDLLFRRQKRPTVKAGGTLRTRIGLLDILAVDVVDPARITEAQARRAGYADVATLRADLTGKPDGEFYRVTVRPGGADPREALRAQADLGPAELAEIGARLDRLDAASADGPWTSAFLGMIAERPHTRAPDLAESIGWETKRFKDHVRKLKALGLTISHSPGYELSPRGRTVWRASRADQ